MHSMQGVSSALIAKNESWVRKQASALARRLPANIERADLIQVGLIAVAQATLAFKWDGDPDTEDARAAFVGYAKLRVKGAMLDELRQMDHLGRAQRRKIKVVQIARERWHALHGADPGLSELSGLCGVAVDEISRLDAMALSGQADRLSDEADPQGFSDPQGAATPADEVEARVDTAIVLRRLEKFFATLPQRDRDLIDAYLGVGMTPVELAASWRITPTRLSQMFHAVTERIARHFGNDERRTLDKVGPPAATPLDELVTLREAELARSAAEGPWGALIEEALTTPADRFIGAGGTKRLVVDGTTRWG
jgi:RNA polymerase sigma factor for flagellar operon FliA